MVMYSLVFINGVGGMEKELSSNSYISKE